MLEALQLGFMRNALVAGILVSIACGIIGAYVVVNRIVFLSGGIAHAAYGGIGLAYLVGSDPTLTAVGFSLLSSMVMGIVHRETSERSDTIIGVIWAIGMALGVIFVDLTPGYKADLMSYLFGSILAVPQRDLWLMLGVDLLVLLVINLLYKELLAVSFDETYATVRNVPVGLVYYSLLALTALTVVMMMRIVGLIMVIALLTIPAAISGQFVSGMRRMMLSSSLLGIVFTVVGLALSFALNLTSGATIILVAATGYLASLAIRLLAESRRRRRVYSAS
jgi:zinc transport system permease protein